MGRNLSIGITSIGITVNLIQAVIVWVATSSFLIGLGAFGAGLLPALATGGSLYLGGRISEKVMGMEGKASRNED